MQRTQIGRLAGGSSPLHVLAALIAVGAAVTSTACQSGERTEAGADDSGAVSAVHEQPDSVAITAASMEVAYACADDKTFSIMFAGQDQIHITFAGEMRILTRAEGHTGQLFSNDEIVFFSQGREASVEVGGVPTFTDCVAEGHPE